MLVVFDSEDTNKIKYTLEMVDDATVIWGQADIFNEEMMRVAFVALNPNEISQGLYERACEEFLIQHPNFLDRLEDEKYAENF